LPVSANILGTYIISFKKILLSLFSTYGISGTMATPSEDHWKNLTSCKANSYHKESIE